MRTTVYVDGFNLYYGALRGTPHRWLNLETLARLLLPQNQITAIKYYTVLVNARPNDPDQPMRQQIYLRALRTLPEVTIHFGHFLTHTVRMPLANPPPGGPFTADVIKAEEKGSDVNIAAHLIADGYENRYEVAVVVSNDSDLAEPVRIVAKDLGKPVGILNSRKHPTRVLLANATFFKQVRAGVLAASQFPPQLTDANGTFHKPASW